MRPAAARPRRPGPGTPSSLPWAIDFGDGIPRHPTQLYESLVMAVAAVIFARLTPRPHRDGDVFKLFMVTYFTLRLLVDVLKLERVSARFPDITTSAIMVTR